MPSRQGHSQLKTLPIPEGDIDSNTLHFFGEGRLTLVELRSKDGLTGVGVCRMSDQDIANSKFKVDYEFAESMARQRAAESIRRQRRGKGIHHLLMR